MRVAIVNDLVIATEALRRMLASEPDCSLAWTAANGAEAVARCAADRPDLVLMDLVMPVMDGVEATRRIMKASPCPILVVTATVDGNFGLVYNALGAGALDAVNCPTFGTSGRLDGAEPVLKKVRALRRLHGPAPRPGTEVAEAAPPRGPFVPAAPTHGPLVLIGSSTGGPDAVAAVLSGATKALRAPIVVVQHLDPAFVPGFVEWLAKATGRRVRAVATGDRPEDGTVHIACTGDHLLLERDGAFRYREEPVEEPYRPSVSVFFASVAAHAARPGVAVVLTGMGRDGADGLLALRRAGWTTIAQDAATSVVYGMPRAAAEAGAAQHVLPLQEIGAAVDASWARLVGATPTSNGR